MRGSGHTGIDTHRCGCRGDCQRKKDSTESHSDTGLAFAQIEEVVAYEVIAQTERIQESYEEKTKRLERGISDAKREASKAKATAAAALLKIETITTTQGQMVQDKVYKAETRRGKARAALEEVNSYE